MQKKAKIEKTKPAEKRPREGVIVSFYLKGSLLKIWQSVENLPEFQNKTDAFRDMLREYAGRRGIIEKLKTEGVDLDADAPTSERSHT